MIVPLSGGNVILNSHKLNENGLFDKPPKLKDFHFLNGNTVAEVGDITDVSILIQSESISMVEFYFMNGKFHYTNCLFSVGV